MCAVPAVSTSILLTCGILALMTGDQERDTIPTEDDMKKATLKSLEKRIAELEERVAQLEPHTSNGIVWKDWRLAVAKVKRTDLADEVDEAGRKIREADRRKARK